MQNLQELKEFYEAISEDEWCVELLEESNTIQRCAVGHVNFMLHGNAQHKFVTSESGIVNGDGILLLEKLGVDIDELVCRNNGWNLHKDGTPKQRSINYINSLIGA